MTPHEYDEFYREMKSGSVYFSSVKRVHVNGGKRYIPEVTADRMHEQAAAHREMNHGGETDPYCKACERFNNFLLTFI